MNWKDGYKAALVETDPAKLLNLIRDTEAAMTLLSESIAVTKQEQQEIGDARCTLRVLKNHVGGDTFWGRRLD